MNVPHSSPSSPTTDAPLTNQRIGAAEVMLLCGHTVTKPLSTIGCSVNDYKRCMGGTQVLVQYIARKRVRSCYR